MKPQEMEFLHDPENGVLGDCLRACVASVLELDRAEVPHFVALGVGDAEDEGMEWWEEMRSWLAERDLECWYISEEYYDPKFLTRASYEELLVSGKTVRGNGKVQHVCVAEPDGSVLHDPHPSRAGLISIDGYYLFAPLGTWAEVSEDLLNKEH